MSRGDLISYDRTLLTNSRYVVDTDGHVADHVRLHHLEVFQIQLPRRAEKSRLRGPREFATMLAGLGLISLVRATLEHRRSQRVLKRQRSDAPGSIGAVVAVMISAFGTIALLTMIFRE
jgi:uncharacterized membrane protein YidH (DUF202 family)